jgi:hypothetical protein
VDIVDSNDDDIVVDDKAQLVSPREEPEGASGGLQLDFGLMGVGEVRAQLLNLTNPNPVNVSLLAVKTNLPKQVSTSMFPQCSTSPTPSR